ncbi:MAG: HWE histidine kinase domain-containing protein [Terricaulis sp.]
MPDADETSPTDESFAAVAEHAPAMLWRGDVYGKCVYLNRAQREFWGLNQADVASFSWATTLLEEDAALVFGPFADAMAQHKAFQCEGRYRRADGVVRILQTRAEPRFEAGVFGGMVGVNVDVTDEREAQSALKRANERRLLMLEEMRHRIKNLMATVVAIAAQTGRSANSLAEFNTSFQARLSALGKSHDLLLQDGSDSAQLRDIIERELTPYLAGNALTRTLKLSGEPVRLNGPAALGLALIVHELATNAAKYGAYSVSGAIDVAWRWTSPTEVMLQWTETGGPAAAQPIRRGFGSTLIETLARSDLGGEIAFHFVPEGLRVELRFAATEQTKA